MAKGTVGARLELSRQVLPTLPRDVRDFGLTVESSEGVMVLRAVGVLCALLDKMPS